MSVCSLSDVRKYMGAGKDWCVKYAIVKSLRKSLRFRRARLRFKKPLKNGTEAGQ